MVSSLILLFVVILQLHRHYFAQALNGPEPFTIKHQYAPSVVATYHSACRLVVILELLMKGEPRLCKRVFGFWFNMFSGVVSHGVLLLRIQHLTWVRLLFAYWCPERLMPQCRPWLLKNFKRSGDYLPKSQKKTPEPLVPMCAYLAVACENSYELTLDFQALLERL